MKSKIFFFLFVFSALFISPSPLISQTAPEKGLGETRARVHVFLDGTIIPEPGKKIEKGILLIRDGLILAVGTEIPIPPDAVVHHVKGMRIYPGLIDVGASFGWKGKEHLKTGHWNALVTPEAKGTLLFQGDKNMEEEYRRRGFTSALVTPDKGILRGTSAFISLSDRNLSHRILAGNTFQGAGLDMVGWNGYPSSLMGAIALLRQTFYDALWYRKIWEIYRKDPKGKEEPEKDLSLSALQPLLEGKETLLFQIQNEWDALRVEKIAREFGLKYILLGCGSEYRRIENISKLQVPIIAPLKMPETPQVSSSEAASSVTLGTLLHFMQARENPAILMKSGLPVALTARGLKNLGDLKEAVQEVMAGGLSADQVLSAFTVVPARIAGEMERRGTLEPGKAADFSIVEGEIFAKESIVRSVWIGGREYITEPFPSFDPRGQWELSLSGGKTLWIHLSGKIEHLQGTLQILKKEEKEKKEKEEEKKKEKKGGQEKKKESPTALSSIEVDTKNITLLFPGKDLGWIGVVRLSGISVPSGILGKITTASGEEIAFTGKKINPEEKKLSPEEKKKEEKKIERPSLPHLFPPGIYGLSSPPSSKEVVVVKNGTLWTCAKNPQILEGVDLLIVKGKIKAVGKNIPTPAGAFIIDATGKHVTPGIIDSHSHIAIERGVNEGSNADTSEVRVGDVMDPDSIAIYRLLAGGTTASHIMHGSANPIGGQNAVIKHRWGSSPEEMEVKDAFKVIKFALGENVKWSSRYPSSRMGVEQFFRHRFQKALEYKKAMEEYARHPEGKFPPRKNLRLDALVEILEGKRIVQCHCYRQDEILMIMKVAEDFGFHIGTFHHVLEGYKVAEAILKHGAHASTFSDWWAYKHEAYDAIPYNGALMHRVGVVVSFNSDSSELSRRLNREAAKAVKYGNVDPQEALKFVTLNAAIQLGMDHRTGSLEVGKDGDFVIWSASPLSTFSRCEQTWIEGRKYFDIEEERKLWDEGRRKKEEIIQYILQKQVPLKK